MSKISILISPKGIQTLSFLGDEDERRVGLQIYLIIQNELGVIDKIIKENYPKLAREDIDSIGH